MEILHLIVWGVVVLTLIGVFFGISLATAARKFFVPSNPLVDEVRDQLPSANCGACGFAGCQSYAEAVVENPNVKTTLCIPGGADVAQRVAELTGKALGEIKELVAVLRCHGTTAVARNQAEYIGIQTCSAAILTFGGPKACKNGCLGLGDCERICQFDAIAIGKEGITVVDYDKCTGCGMCVSICPKGILELYPKNHRVELSCVAKNKASVVREVCLVGCITCRRCVSKCPAGAIEWTGTTIKIDHEKCIAYGPDCKEICVDICPTSVLHRIGQKPLTEEAKSKQVV